MARPFSYPEVAALEVGGEVRISEHAPTVRQKVKGYAKRAGKAFSVRADRGAYYADVRRLPDPEPEVA